MILFFFFLNIPLYLGYNNKKLSIIPNKFGGLNESFSANSFNLLEDLVEHLEQLDP